MMNQQLAPPKTIRRSVHLIYASAALAAVGVVLGATDREQLRRDVVRSHRHASSSTIATDMNALLVTLVVAGVIDIAVWLWIARMNLLGRRWARVAATAFLCLLSGYLLTSFLQPTPLRGHVVGILEFATAFLAVVGLWQPESTEYYYRDNG